MLYRRTLRYEPLEVRRLLATVTVNTLADTIDLADGLTSLREAIFATNLVAGPDIIEFSSSLPAIVTLTQGELRITDSLTIRKQSGLITLDAIASDPTPAVNNGDGSRIFNIDDGNSSTFVQITIEGLTLAGGDAPLSGGAIFNRENLTLSRMRVNNNSASSIDISVLSTGGAIAHSLGMLELSDCEIASNSADFGGGIHVESGSLVVDRSVIAMNSSVSGSGIYIASGDAEIARSWIHGNTAGAFSLGGGIYNSSNLRVESTTISGNSASFGAGVFSRTHEGEATRISNSTISGNTAFDRGGGVRNAEGLTQIEHSTITANVAPPGDGGGIASRGYSNALTLVGSSIVAGNTSSDVDFVTGDIGSFMSLGYNLVGTGNATAKFNAAGDRTGIANTMLGPLANNGGPILPDGNRLLTHAVLPGSPAINAGELNSKAGVGDVPLYDQRGDPFARIVNGRIDIGAYEFEEPSDLNLVVTNLADESDGNFSLGSLTLREAIELANQWPSTDTIRFAPSLTASGPIAIVLKMGELKITDDVTIEGPGGELLTIDASGSDPTPDIDDGKGRRAFNITDGTDKLIDVSIVGLTLTGGDFGFAAENGGAIFSRENLTISAAAITGNSATFGGGIDQLAGSLTIANSTISGNSARMDGGAVWSSGVLMITSSTISGNSASRGGGGILGINTPKTIINSTIGGNRAQEYGGGIGVRGNAILTISGSMISNNLASNSAGGGIRTTESRVTVTDSMISGNSANLGGGMAIYNGQLTVTNSTISNNSATGTANVSSRGYGGGIFSSQALPVLTGSTISGNTAAMDGGGLVGQTARSSWMITNSTISGNTAGRDGGGIRGSLTLTNSTVSGNSAGRNGGGVAGAFGPVRVSNSTISGNMAAALGGGIWSVTSTIEHATIASNQAGTAGGGIFVSGISFPLRHTIVANNTASMGLDLTGLIGAVISPQFSLIGNNASSGLTPAPPNAPDANGNIIGGVAPNNINPRLAPLDNYGGPNKTHALLANSPALNAGDPAALPGVGTVPLHDLRGEPFMRVFGGRIDIGAFEVQPNLLLGDYNMNGAVDAADYALWRNTRGSTTDLRADGNGDGVVSDADRLVWRANFGKTAGSMGQGAGSDEFEAIAIAPKPPASPADKAADSLERGADNSSTTLRRRAVGSRPIGSFLMDRTVRRDDSMSSTVVPPRSSSDERPELSVQPQDQTYNTTRRLADARASVLDRVFEALGHL